MEGILYRTIGRGNDLKHRIQTILFYLAIFLLLLASFSLNWTGDNFGGVGFDEIMFHLNMPLKGAGQSFVGSYIRKALIPAAGIVVEIIIGKALLKTFLGQTKKEKLFRLYKYCTISRILIILIWACAVSVRAQKWFGFFDYVKSIVQRSNFIAEEYISPQNVTLTFPDKKRNLIYIFVESGETSTQDISNGGLMNTNYIPELTEIAKDNISFSQSDLLEGAAVAPLCGWTIAGMVAETAGVPMKLYSTHNSKTNNSMNQYKTFMPGLTSLGEILEQQGYHNYFMAGSDFDFGGRYDYTTQHGNYEVLDYNVALEKEIIPFGYYVWWGFEDQILFQWAKEELAEISKKDEPFNFSILTVDTHCQDGYVCPLCQNDYSEQYANVWACSSRQIDEFVSWCQKQSFYENTTIIICGDHCSMDRDFYGTHTYSSYKGETVRKVYNAFINSAVEPTKEKNRMFTTLDMFPSTLSALGVKIDGERLGLGVNLFSGEQTLVEKYGYEYMFEELSKMSAFYNKELLYPRE